MLAAFRLPVALALALVGPASTAPAQTPPSPAELEAYRGLHAAAAHGGAEEIRRFAAGGADLNARDGNGRTPLHVAAFQGRRDAARALLEAKADPALLDRQRYDALTIAAVRDDAEMVRILLTAARARR